MTQRSSPDRYDDLSPEAIAAHDRQRVMPDDALRALVTQIQSYIGQGKCLDAGAGTGAIAIPLAAAGTPVIGLDVSRAMLQELRGRLPEADNVSLVRGDMTRLPFRDEMFVAVHCAHTIHLIADWRSAVTELHRTTASSGVLLFCLGSGLSPVPGLQDVQRAFFQAIDDASPNAQESGPVNEEEFTAGMMSLGVTSLPRIELQYQQTTSIAIEIDRLEHNVFGRSDILDQEALHTVAQHTRGWAVDRFGSLDKPLVRTRTLIYHVFRKDLRQASGR